MTDYGNDRVAVVGALRLALQFSVGSVLVLREKTEEFVTQAIEKGQGAEKEGRKLVQEMRTERNKTQPQEIDADEVRINTALERLNVPTDQEIHELNSQIATLSERLDELQSSL